MTGPRIEPDEPPSGDGQQARAEEVIRAISEGADPANQAFHLSNQFTDDWTSRGSAWIRRLFRGRRST